MRGIAPTNQNIGDFRALASELSEGALKGFLVDTLELLESGRTAVWVVGEL